MEPQNLTMKSDVETNLNQYYWKISSSLDIIRYRLINLVSILTIRFCLISHLTVSNL